MKVTSIGIGAGAEVEVWKDLEHRNIPSMFAKERKGKGWRG